MGDEPDAPWVLSSHPRHAHIAGDREIANRRVAPAFVKAEQSLYPDDPVWRIEMTSPVWPKAPNSSR
jgi:hypothetical protein